MGLLVSLGIGEGDQLDRSEHLVRCCYTGERGLV